MKKITTLIILTLSLSSCVSNRVFNDLESRYAGLKDNYNRQTKSIENLNAEIKDLTEKFVHLETTLEATEDSLNQKQQNIEKLESSLDLLKQNSESALKERIAENETLLEKIADRENEFLWKRQPEASLSDLSMGVEGGLRGTPPATASNAGSNPGSSLMAQVLLLEV